MPAMVKKILLLLAAGTALGFSYAPRRQIKIIKNFPEEWKKIDEQEIKKAIRNLYRSKIVSAKENSDGTYTLCLTTKGKLKTLKYSFGEMKPTKTKWDGKWRIVIFDIPEKMRSGRDALRSKLREMGFYELQKSVFIFPYKCEEEIEFVIEFFNLRRWVRFGTLDFVDNELHLKKIFELI